jgi:hypothetical protein
MTGQNTGITFLFIGTSAGCMSAQTTIKGAKQMKNTLLDIAAAVAIGLSLAVGALAYFDILWS